MKYDAEAVTAAKERGEEVSEDGVEEAFDVSNFLPSMKLYWIIYLAGKIVIHGLILSIMIY